MKAKKTLFSAMLTHEHWRKFKDIAESRGKTMSAVLREWIDRSHKQLEVGK